MARAGAILQRVAVGALWLLAAWQVPAAREYLILIVFLAVLSVVYWPVRLMFGAAADCASVEHWTCPPMLSLAYVVIVSAVVLVALYVLGAVTLAAVRAIRGG